MMDIFPTPKKCCFSGKITPLPENPVLEILYPEELTETAGVIRQELMSLIPGLRFDANKAFAQITLKTECSLGVPEAYELTIHGREICFNGRDRSGVIYACASFRQLLTENASYTAKLPDVTLSDWPDVRYRACSRWLIEYEGSRMAYDWGDGRENFLRRCREKISFAMRYKINCVFFDGFHWDTNKYPQYVQDVLSLNRYARARGVRLEFGGHYIGIGGRDPSHHKSIGCGFQKGLGDLNRRSYPDGEIYKCTGASEDHPTRFNGACRSNDELNRIKAADLARYVSILEPGMLYLHPEDISAISELESDWSFRCPECRKKWPSDTIEERSSAAGAQGYALKLLCDAVASVKKPDGYDGAKDCLICIVPMAYAATEISDQAYDRIKVMYRNIAEAIPEAPLPFLLMREQFASDDGDHYRTLQMCENLCGTSCKVAMFAINGADNYTNGRLFSAAPLLNGYYQGAEMIFNFAGTLHQEIQEAFNSECCWNIPKIPKNVQKRFTRGRTSHPREELMLNIQDAYVLPAKLFSSHGFLPRFCHQYYGRKAGDGMLELLQLGKGKETYPFFSLAYRFERQKLLSGARADRAVRQTRTKMAAEWRAIHKNTLLAYNIVRKIKKNPLDAFVRETLDSLARSLLVACEIAAIVKGMFANTVKTAELLKQVRHVRGTMQKQFQFHFLNPDDGEHGAWPEYLARLENRLKEMS